MRSVFACCLTAALTVGLALELMAAPPKASSTAVRELRVQRVGEVTYFHLRLEAPPDLATDSEQLRTGFFPAFAPSTGARLVSADGRLRLVCQRIGPGGPGREMVPGDLPVATPRPEVATKHEQRKEVGKAEVPARDRGPRQPVPVQGLEFVGRCDATGPATVKLLYAAPGRPLPGIGHLLARPLPPVWKEVDLALDLPTAKRVEVPAEAAERRAQPRPDGGAFRNPPVRDDLEGLWAVARTEQLLGWDNEVTEFGFYGFAAASTARRYGVQGPGGFEGRLAGRIQQGGGGEFFNHDLYETTTGAAAITESLQLRRMNGVAPTRAERRTVALDKIQGIDIAEHPWEQMMGDRRPAPEPFAKLVPHDNYYIHFKKIARFIEFTELLDQWGTSLVRAYELTSRDHRLKQRYERQLCLRSTELGKTLGPLVIKGIAVTGSDAYVREGSDVAVLFQVIDRGVFLAAVEPFLAEARQKFSGELTEAKTDYRGVTIESFVTPLREVSLYRAGIGDVVVYANSPAGIRRVLDAAAGRLKSLSESLDFRYMRTVFRYDDPDEDGFAFLSDPFIRNLVGPAGKIKEKRRLEALTSLQMLTYGAMLTSWEAGKAPNSAADILRATGLVPEELPLPEGKPAAWDPVKRMAVSDVYNTENFATPLIELPIDKVTPVEAAEYQRFRMEYLGLWRQYFDPIGMRVSLRDGRVKLDTYILPLIENSVYNRLRAVTGKGTVRLDPTRLSSKTLVQYMMHLSTDATERGGWLGDLGLRGGNSGGGLAELGLAAALAWAVDPVGEWFLVRVDDSPNYERLVALAERSEKGGSVEIDEVARLVWTLPVAIGVDVRNPLSLTAALTALRAGALSSLPGALTWGPLEKEYKGVSIVRVQATPAGRQMLGALESRRSRSDPFLPAVYYALIDGGFYLTLNEEMMRELIDGVLARNEGKTGAVEVNSSLHLSPGAAEHTKGILKRYLEFQTHQQARQGLAVWYALYQCGAIAEDAAAEDTAGATYRWLGFVPVSPDGSAYRFDRKHDEVVNERHGSYRAPVLKTTTADSSPLNRLLDTVRSLRADLRFREDGIHTVLTLERPGGKE